MKFGIAPFGTFSLAALVALTVASPSPAATTPAQSNARFSSSGKVTEWANPASHDAPIRSSHSAHADRVTSTHAYTEDGFPEVYLVLRSWSDSKGHTWLEVRVPMRPNGTKGWVRETGLGHLHRVTTSLVVDQSALRATLYDRGRRIWSAPVGIGAPSTPTPTGHFWIREKFKLSDQGSLYGPAAFGTSAYSVLSDWPGGGVVGIHGTNEPALIPGNPSHGCIRLRNEAVRDLWRLLPVGTPLLIH